jgi:hypothetical protein
MYTKKSKLLEWKQERDNPRHKLMLLLDRLLYPDLTALILRYVSHPCVSFSPSTAECLRAEMDHLNDLVFSLDDKCGYTFLVQTWDVPTYTLSCYRSADPSHVIRITMVGNDRVLPN